MMRRAYFGTNALILIGFHLVLVGLDLLQVFPYVATMFYPMLNIMGLVLSIMGYLERDKVKWPSLVSGIVLVLSLTFWIVALVLRLIHEG